MTNYLPGPYSVTPVVRSGPYWLKRDDLYSYAGVRGGKVRTCSKLAEGASGLVTAGARSSPQANIVARIARMLGIPCRVHTPAGPLGTELELAQAAGAEVVQHPRGHNSVIVARARADAQARGWREIPFGMECAEAVTQTANQVVNFPDEAERVVVPVGSGMSLAGVLHGLALAGRVVPVVGVTVGADPRRRLDRYAPLFWPTLATLVPAGVPYDREVAGAVGDVDLDPVYEAKCLPFLRPGDLLWVVGCRTVAHGQ